MDPDRVAVPPRLAEHAARFAASGAAPAVPRLAATVILLRDQAAGLEGGAKPRVGELLEGGAKPWVGELLEVYTQRRAATMAFAAGMYAFPGGGVAPADAEAPPGPDPGPVLADRLGLPADSARAVAHAAVRELNEETGVRLRADQLAPWARWLTPEFEPRRYDTFFFLAPIPADQNPAEPAGEADHALWLPPAEALSLPMLPPTRYTLTELARFPDVASAIVAAAQRDVSTPVRPAIEVDADGVWLRLR
jgi:8-oxo-dGTP pyrophosphatase MutT (NUDIX family)